MRLTTEGQNKYVLSSCTIYCYNISSRRHESGEGEGTCTYVTQDDNEEEKVQQHQG